MNNFTIPRNTKKNRDRDRDRDSNQQVSNNTGVTGAGGSVVTPASRGNVDHLSVPRRYSGGHRSGSSTGPIGGGSNAHDSQNRQGIGGPGRFGGGPGAPGGPPPSGPYNDRDRGYGRPGGGPINGPPRGGGGGGGGGMPPADRHRGFNDPRHGQFGGGGHHPHGQGHHFSSHHHRHHHGGGGGGGGVPVGGGGDVRRSSVQDHHVHDRDRDRSSRDKDRDRDRDRDRHHDRDRERRRDSDRDRSSGGDRDRPKTHSTSASTRDRPNISSSSGTTDRGYDRDKLSISTGSVRQGSLSRSSSHGSRLGGSHRTSPIPIANHGPSPPPVNEPVPSSATNNIHLQSIRDVVDIEVASEDPFKMKFRKAKSSKGEESLLSLFPRSAMATARSLHSSTTISGGVGITAIPRKKKSKRKLITTNDDDDDDDDDGMINEIGATSTTTESVVPGSAAASLQGDESFLPSVSGDSTTKKSNKRIRISSKKLSETTSKETTSGIPSTSSTTGGGGGRLKRVKKASLNDDSEDDEVLKELLAPIEESADTAGASDDPNNIDAPPPGELASLWYSREQFLHVFAIEKILSWKLRPKPITLSKPLEWDLALKLHTEALVACSDDRAKRMEISRINAIKCPVVSQMVKDMESLPPNESVTGSKAAEATEEGEEPENPPSANVTTDSATTSTATSSDPAARPTAREEVYLIKWRGRSYQHCSWERYVDLVKYDPSTNSAAKTKINRFVQQQEAILGKHWKQVLEDSRRGGGGAQDPDGATEASDVEKKGIEPLDETSKKVMDAAATALATATPSTAAGSSTSGGVTEEEEEEFFPPDYLEVERIVGCDEAECDMSVFAKQRTVNIRSEVEEEKSIALNEVSSCEVTRRYEKTKRKLHEGVVKIKRCIDTGTEPEWDPEDYVQYAVKWKALPFSEITYEYWRDIKRDYVELVEDFWNRQKAPADDIITKASSKKHPELQHFVKMKESPVFGITSSPRPMYDFDKNKIILDDPDKSNKDGVGDDDGTTKQGLQLRSYQLEGVNWLLFNWWNQRSCILADEMGLGKTIQTIGFLSQLSSNPHANVRGPFLIVAPLSLIQQWQSEAAVWAPDFNVIVYHGSANSRLYIQNHEFYYTEPFVNKTTSTKLRKSNITKFHIMITTYEVVMKDIEIFQKIKWRAIVVDEAHRLKNNKSRLFIDLAAVPRDFCLLLTGTPLQNSTEELWALLNFADPTHFASKESFIEKFGQLNDAKQVSDLHTILKPYLLRRVKEDVAKSLPPKEETILEVTLTPIQKQFYKAIYERNTSFLFKGAKPSNSPSLMNIMMELRKCCNHPFLIRGAEEKIVGEAAAAAIAAATAAGKAADSVDMIELTTEQLVKSSGKMVLLGKLLPKLYDGGHKVLIFSQMVRTLDILNDFLRLKQYTFERLDGSTSAAARNAAVNRFNRKSLNRFIMLLSTRAGGLGLNLTAADTIIIFDSDWNPQNDLQAMARAHRIGQTRAVSVYRLLTAKTYEMHMFHSASMKLGLDRAMLAQQRNQFASDGTGGENDDGDGSNKLSKSNRKLEREKQAKEIDELLKKGAYDVFRDEDDKEAKEFMETDIDKLLERSTKTVTYGNTTNTNGISSGLGSFSKASFVTTTDDGGDEVDIDDPDFWKKAVGLEAPEQEVDDETAALVQAYADKKRVRKQVVNYGTDPYTEYMDSERKEKEKLKAKAKAEREEKEKNKSKDKSKKKKKHSSGDGTSVGGEEKKHKKVKTSKSPTSSLKKSKSSGGDADDKTTKSTGTSNGGSSKPSTTSIMIKTSSSAGGATTANSAITDQLSAVQRTVTFEQLKYAWEPRHRDAVVDAIYRFGFGRVCKIRQESSLPGLPMQDLELFARCFLYQLGLQASVSVMSQFKNQFISTTESREDGITTKTINSPLSAISNVLDPITQCCGSSNSTRDCFESKFVLSAISSSLTMNDKVLNNLRYLRMIPTLLDTAFVSRLRKGEALKGLRRIATLTRLNSVMTIIIDNIVRDLGPEELGKRGSSTKNYSELELDVKCKLVTIEELSHAIAELYDGHVDGLTTASDATSGANASLLSTLPIPCPWWDRSCDIGILVGNFLCGYGDYEIMGYDDQLPFKYKLHSYGTQDIDTLQSMISFGQAIQAVTDLMVTANKAAGATNSSKVKKETSKNEGNANDGANTKIKIEPPETNEEGNAKQGSEEVIKKAKVEESDEKKSATTTTTTGATFQGLTLRQLHNAALDGFRRQQTLDNNSTKNQAVDSSTTTTTTTIKKEESVETSESAAAATTTTSKKSSKDDSSLSKLKRLPMPDGRILDCRLLAILDDMETFLQIQRSGTKKDFDCNKSSAPVLLRGIDADLWVDNYHSTTTTSNVESSSGHCSQRPRRPNIVLPTYSCRYMSSFPSSSIHPDASNYAHGPASSELQVFASQGKKILSNNGIPKVVSRISIAALLVSKTATVDNVVKFENSKSSSSNNNADGTEQGRQSNTTYAIPQILINNSIIRRKISVYLLNTGFPYDSYSEVRSKVTKGLWDLLPSFIQQSFHNDDYTSSSSTCPSFITCDQVASDLSTNLDGGTNPNDSAFSFSGGMLTEYIEKALLPHCLRLCLNGNGIGSRVFQKTPNITKKKKETAATSICTELKLNESAISSSYERLLPSNLATLPDPVVPINLHSDEAIVRSLAILRRYRLMKSIRYIVGGGVSPEILDSFLRGPVMRRNLSDVPLWWCPWIHDLTVLVYAATYGLFSLFDPTSTKEKGSSRRKKSSLWQHVLSKEVIKKHICSIFINDEQSPARLPQCFFEFSQQQQTDKEDYEDDDDDERDKAILQEWVDSQILEFPTPQVLERRMALICSSLTTDSSMSDGNEKDGIFSYDHVPMLDHGAWPFSGLPSEIGSAVVSNEHNGTANGIPQDVDKTSTAPTFQRRIGGVKYGNDVQQFNITQSLLKTVEEDLIL